MKANVIIIAISCLSILVAEAQTESLPKTSTNALFMDAHTSDLLEVWKLNLNDSSYSEAHILRLENKKSNNELSSQQNNAERTSPYRLSWKTDGIILGTGLVAQAIELSMDGSRTPLSMEQAQKFSHRDVHWFDRSASYKFNKDLRNVSDQLGAFSLIAPLGLLADKGVRKDLLSIGLMFMELRLFADALPAISKQGITRYRPYVYNPNVSYEDKIEKDPGQSFFASQTTSVFSSAVFVATVFSDYNPESKYKAWVWAGSLAAASAISYVRYETGIHYTSDILVGAAVGSAIGYFIPKLHRVQKNNSIIISPAASAEAYTLNATIKL